MTRLWLAAVAALATALPSIPAWSAPTGFASRPTELMTRFDSNLDGSVDAAEYVAYLAKGFSARDVDGNGVLEGRELPPNAAPLARAAYEARLTRQFQRQDRNADGRLDAAELLAPPRL